MIIIIITESALKTYMRFAREDFEEILLNWARPYNAIADFSTENRLCFR